MLGPSQLSTGARLLYCILLRYCGNDESCFPSQATLAKDMSISPRQTRNLLDELIRADLVLRRRKGWNRSNTYIVTKSFTVERKGTAFQLGSKFPLQLGNSEPTKNTYLIEKDKRSIKGLELMRKALAVKLAIQA